MADLSGGVVTITAHPHPRRAGIRPSRAAVVACAPVSIRSSTRRIRSRGRSSCRRSLSVTADLGEPYAGVDPDRDGVLVDVQTEVDRGEVRDTSHGRLPPYGGSARSVWVTHVDAD